MNVGSLFSGIGGFDLGLERAGMRVVWQCEANEYRRRVLGLRFPGVPCLPDVRELDPGAVEPVDLVCGGFPCVDISNAGRRAGIDGPGSRLWAEMFRVVDGLRPRYVVVENVSALLRRGMGRVIGDLASIGYDAEWDCLRAADFGAPHLRDRVWIVAYPVCSGLEGSGLRRPVGNRGGEGAMADAKGQRSELRSAEGQRLGRPSSSGALADTGRERVERRGAAGQVAGSAGPRAGEGSEWQRLRDTARGGGAVVFDPDQLQQGQRGRIERAEARAGGRHLPVWAVEPDVGRVAHGIPARVDRLAALGDALVPQIAEWIGRQILNYETLSERCRGKGK